jgi:hypothetical protein
MRRSPQVTPFVRQDRVPGGGTLSRARPASYSQITPLSENVLDGPREPGRHGSDLDERAGPASQAGL